MLFLLVDMRLLENHHVQNTEGYQYEDALIER